VHRSKKTPLFDHLVSKRQRTTEGGMTSATMNLAVIDGNPLPAGRRPTLGAAFDLKEETQSVVIAEINNSGPLANAGAHGLRFAPAYAPIELSQKLGATIFVSPKGLRSENRGLRLYRAPISNIGGTDCIGHRLRCRTAVAMMSARVIGSMTTTIVAVAGAKGISLIS
jgi:hypothetical protein